MGCMSGEKNSKFREGVQKREGKVCEGEGMGLYSQ